MPKYKCLDCGQEYNIVLEACPNCGCPTTSPIMSKIKCADCGCEYDSAFEACPNCGCPNANQVEQEQRDTNHSQDRTQPNRKADKKKVAFIVLSTIIVIVVAVGLIWILGNTYERKILKIEKKANEFKATLSPDNQIIAEVIDSVAQKVYYIEKNIDDYDVYGAPLHKILVHDYATDETQSVLPSSGSVDNFVLCGSEYIDSKLIEDRLFFLVHSNCMWWLGATGVFYVNIRDNSLHYVESCNEAIFSVNGDVLIHKYYNLGTKGGGDNESDSKEYHLSPMLSDEEYLDNRRKQERIEEQLAEEWGEKEEMRRREEEVRIKEKQIRNVKDWLYGTWEITRYDVLLGRYTAYVSITENKLRLGYNGQEVYNGPYEIDMQAHKIIFDHHDGYYTSLGFDPRTERLVDEGHYFTKVNGLGTHTNTNEHPGNSFNAGYSNNSLQFRNDYDVINYTSSHTFKNNAGNSIKINFQGLYLNGKLVTNAPRVLNFSGSIATISVSSPFNGGGARIIRVDSSRGTITDGSGDVFRAVN